MTRHFTEKISSSHASTAQVTIDQAVCHDIGALDQHHDLIDIQGNGR